MIFDSIHISYVGTALTQPGFPPIKHLFSPDQRMPVKIRNNTKAEAGTSCLKLRRSIFLKQSQITLTEPLNGYPVRKHYLSLQPHFCTSSVPVPVQPHRKISLWTNPIHKLQQQIIIIKPLKSSKVFNCRIIVMPMTVGGKCK